MRRATINALPLLLAGSMALLAGCSESGAGNDVRIVVVPMHGTSPDARLGPRGELHLVFGVGADVYYAVSRDAGQHFSTAIRVNDESGSSQSGMFRGPELALAADGSAHVAWYGRAKSTAGPPLGMAVMYSNMRDGKAFQPASRIASGTVDGLSLATRGDAVIAAWQDGREVQIASSTTGGASFPVASGLGGVACECCDTSLSAAPDGPTYVAYRDRAGNRRDMYLLEVDASGRRVARRLKLDSESWLIEACPMSSVGIARQDDAMFVAWEHAGKVLLARVDLAAWTRSPPIVVARQGKHPVLALDEGALLVAWKQHKELNWRIYEPGTLSAKSEGRSQSGTSNRPAAIASPKEGFVLFP